MSDKDLSERKIRDGLQCPSLVSKIEIFKELDSTNRYAKELAIHGAPEGTVIWRNSRVPEEDVWEEVFFHRERKEFI